MHHGIDLKEPIHNVKNARIIARTGRHAPGFRVFINLDIVAKELVEPIGIEPMT